MKNAISVESLSISFQSGPLLKNISFQIQEGEYVVITGENGSGKSTLIKALLGMQRIDSGTITLFGVSQKLFKDWFRVGYVPQNFSLGELSAPLTVEELVSSGFNSKSNLNIVEALKYALDLVDIGAIAKLRMSELSGGQQQRVMIARGLINKPQLLILDEPTSGVDVENRYSLLDFLRKLNNDQHITIIHITHDVESVAQICDRVLCIEQTELCKYKQNQEHTHG